MSCLADTNVLLRYVQQNHNMHGVAVAALDFLVGSGETVVIVLQNITEFWNVCTRPTDQNGLGLTPSETDKQVLLLESVLAVLPESPVVYPEWRRLVVTHSVSGVRVYDARMRDLELVNTKIDGVEAIDSGVIALRGAGRLSRPRSR
jgi:predicted nucleic acid-binding protein